MQTLPVLCGRKNSLSWRSPLSGDLSDASMVLNRPSDDVSAIRPMLSLYPATTKGATVTAAHNAAQSVEDEVAGHEVTGGSNTMQPGTHKADELVDALREPSVESHLSGGLFSDSMICHPLLMPPLSSDRDQHYTHAPQRMRGLQTNWRMFFSGQKL